MKTYLSLISVVSTISLLMGCEPPEPPLAPLSRAELNTLNMLEEKFEKVKKQKEAYKKEVERINTASKTYLDEYVLFDDFSFYKTNRFDDKRDRLCYKGKIENTGSEIIERIGLHVALHHPNGERITSWEPTLLSANDELIDKDPTSAATQLVLAVSGKKLPLGPGEILSLVNNRNCMKDVYLDWNVDDITYKVISFKLRSAIPEPDGLDLIRIAAKIHELRKRAVQNNQLDKG